MKIDLNKCKAGDKLVRRDGDVMTYKSKCSDGRHELKYSGRTAGTGYWTSKGGFGWDVTTKETFDSDIVSIKPPKPVKKSIRFTVERFQHGYKYVAYERSIMSFLYGRPSDAIRGAKRFCKSIGHECAIVKEAE